MYNFLSKAEQARISHTGRDGLPDQVQFFRQEHPGFARAGCGSSATVLPGLPLQFTIHVLGGLRPESLHV